MPKSVIIPPGTSTPIAPFSSCWQISATLRAKVASSSDGSATSR